MTVYIYLPLWADTHKQMQPGTHAQTGSHQLPVSKAWMRSHILLYAKRNRFSLWVLNMQAQWEGEKYYMCKRIIPNPV